MKNGFYKSGEVPFFVPGAPPRQNILSGQPGGIPVAPE